MDIYKKDGFLHVYYDEINKYIVFKWASFAIRLEDIQEAHARALDALQRTGATTYVAETSEVKGVLSDAILEWWGKTWMPKLVSGGLKQVITVVPKSALGRMSTKEWQAVNFGGIVTKNCRDMAEANAFIRSRK